MTTTDPMVEFLRQRLDEVQTQAEAVAKLAPSPWRTDGGLVEHSGPTSGPDYDYEKDAGLWDSEGCTEDYHRLCMRHDVAQYVAAFDPATVLRHVAGARKMLELHGSYPDGGCRACDDGYQRPMTWPCDNLWIEAERWGWTPPLARRRAGSRR